VGDGIPQVIMDWKQVQQRLSEYESLPLVSNEGRYTTEKYKYTPKQFKEFWDLCHQNRYSSFSELIGQVFKVTTDRHKGTLLAQCRRWYEGRGWGELPERKCRYEKLMPTLLEENKNGVTPTQLTKKYDLNLSTLLKKFEEYDTVKKGRRKFDEQTIQQWIEMRKKRISYEVIAKQFNTDKTIIHKYTKDKVVHKTKTEIYKDQVMDYVNSGITNRREIARLIGINDTLVYRIIIDHKKNKIIKDANHSTRIDKK